MRIGIDMLGNQTSSSRKRGVGRYVRGLVSNLLVRHPRHEYFLYHHPTLIGLDDTWPGRAAVREIPPIPGDATLRDTADRLLLDNPDQLDVYLVPSPIEGYGGYQPPPKPLDGPKMAAVIHDLIPALYQHQCKGSPHFLWSYSWAMRIVRQYDLLLTNSEWTRADCLRWLGLPPDQVMTIGAASDPEFFFPDRSREPDRAASERLHELGITSPFVFYISGDDERKNHKGLLAAFGLLPARLRETHQLVITCQLPAAKERDFRETAERHGVADRLVLTSYVPDEVTRLLYQRCAAFAFVSRYEGFGFPLLEAMHCGAPVLAGRNSSQIEVVGDAGLFAEVDDHNDVAAQLERLLVDRELAQSLRERGPARAARFSWESTADRAAEAIEALAPTRRLDGASSARKREKPRLAFFSPLPPLRSGIADYSDRLLTVIKSHYRIDLYHDEGFMPQLGLSSSEFTCRDHRLFDRSRRAVDYTGVVYQMANTPDCAFVYETLLRHPGVVVLHDHSLPEFHFNYAFDRAPRGEGAPDFFADEIAFESADLGSEYRASREAWSAETGGIIQACFRRGLTFNRRILESAALVIVHDRWVAGQISRTCPHLAERLRVVPHGASLQEVSPERKQTLRQRFGFSENALILSCFGMLNGMKYHGEAIEALAAIVKDYPRARLLFVGGDLNGGQERTKAAALGLSDHVRFFEYPPMETFLDLTTITDVGINLRRPPTRGETSGALLTLLSAGVPTIVTDVDAFSSYPDTVVEKIGPLGPSDRALEQTLRRLLDRPELRRQLGQCAMRHVEKFHNWSRVASLYAEVIEESRNRVQGPTAIGCRRPPVRHSSMVSFLGNTPATS